MEREDRQRLADAIYKIVDKWVSDLIGQLLSKDSGGPKRTLWDRFKGGVSNLMYGRDNKDNPYYYMNRFGDDLGWRQAVRSECFNPGFLNLHEYATIKSSIDDAETKVETILQEEAEGELRIVSLLRQAGNELKKSLASYILGGGAADGAEADIPPAREPEHKPIPPSTPDPDEPGPTVKRDEPAPTPTPVPSSKRNEPVTVRDRSIVPEKKKDDPVAAEPAKENPEEISQKKAPATRQNQPSFSNSLEEAIRALKEGRTSSLNPEKSWLTPSGKISYLALPKAVAWIGLKSHIDIENDDQVNNELKKAIGDEFKGLPMSKKDGNSLLKSLVSKLPENSWASTLRDLGIDEALAEKMKTRTFASAQQASETGDNPPKGKLEEIRDGSSNVEELVSLIKEKIIQPVMKKTPHKHALRDWWRNFKETDDDIDSLKKKIFNDGESELISLLVRVSGLEEEEIMSLID